MTTEEKLQKFLETSMEDARSRSMALFHEYKDALDQMNSMWKMKQPRRSCV